jgi:hypothetical protein
MAWPSTSRTPATWSPGAARNTCSKWSTSSPRSWVVKNVDSFSRPSKHEDSCSRNSFCPPPNSGRTFLGKCSCSAVFSNLCKYMCVKYKYTCHVQSFAFKLTVLRSTFLYISIWFSFTTVAFYMKKTVHCANMYIYIYIVKNKQRRNVKAE